MQIIKIISFLFLFINLNLQAQKKADSSKQTRSIEINNENGQLSIHFENSVITEFIVNDVPIAKESYKDYQDIINDFNQESSKETMHSSSPKIPCPPNNNEDLNELLRQNILGYLIEEKIIESASKYKVELRSEFLKVDGQMVSNQIHNQCLDLFHKIYSHQLNHKSVAKFQKSRSNSKSMVSILD